MNMARRCGAASVCLLLALLLGSCGSSVAPPPPPPPKSMPFKILEVQLRPLAFQRTSQLARGLPSPVLAAYNLSAFYQGGREMAKFLWQIPESLGTVEPKSFAVGSEEATVALKPRERLSLGFVDVKATGRSGAESDSVTARFAVVENVWMKHERVISSALRPPDNLVLFPCLLPPGGDRTSEDIIYVGAPSPYNTKLQRFTGYQPLSSKEGARRDVWMEPDSLWHRPVDLGEQPVNPKAEVCPDVAPAGLGTDEILFSAQLDVQYTSRCPDGNCASPFPFNIWIVKSPSPELAHRARPLTWDSSYREDNRTRWRVFNYLQPRWDPKSSGAAPRIGFLSNRDRIGAPPDELWLADLRARPGSADLDTLLNYTQLTNVGGVTSYTWHPHSGRIYFTRGGSLYWIDPNTPGPGAGTPIVLPEGLTSINWVTVFSRDGERSLVAFQATAESMVNLYVYEEDDAGTPVAGTLTRLLPFPMSARTNNLFPRWHPTRKELLYVSDYSVEAWTVGDRPPIVDPEAYGQTRTLYPSVWSLRLE